MPPRGIHVPLAKQEPAMFIGLDLIGAIVSFTNPASQGSATSKLLVVGSIPLNHVCIHQSTIIHKPTDRLISPHSTNDRRVPPLVPKGPTTKQVARETSVETGRAAVGKISSVLEYLVQADRNALHRQSKMGPVS